MSFPRMRSPLQKITKLPVSQSGKEAVPGQQGRTQDGRPLLGLVLGPGLLAEGHAGESQITLRHRSTWRWAEKGLGPKYVESV